jgi:hypothetical protein
MSMLATASEFDPKAGPSLKDLVRKSSCRIPIVEPNRHRPEATRQNAVDLADKGDAGVYQLGELLQAKSIRSYTPFVTF